jgi:hypothetical protein
MGGQQFSPEGWFFIYQTTESHLPEGGGGGGNSSSLNIGTYIPN